MGIRSEPLTWNRLLATDETSHKITEQIHSALVRVNRVTQELEPELAESWSFSPDGRELTFKLRPGVSFSDGVPFTAEDVAFTFRALHHPEVASPLIDTVLVDGEPLVPDVLDPYTRFVSRFRVAPRSSSGSSTAFRCFPVTDWRNLSRRAFSSRSTGLARQKTGSWGSVPSSWSATCLDKGLFSVGTLITGSLWKETSFPTWMASSRKSCPTRAL